MDTPNLKAPHPAALAHAARSLPADYLAKLPPSLQELAQRAVAAPLTADEQRKAGVLAYLHDERELVATRRALAPDGDPFTYMPTVLGNVTAGVIGWSDLNADELGWVVDEYTRQRRNAENWPGGDPAGIAAAQAMIDQAQAELARRGLTHEPPPAPERAPTTIPESPHPLGR